MCKTENARIVRNAVYTMLAIVTSHLLCSSLHLILTVMEQSKSSLLVFVRLFFLCPSLDQAFIELNEARTFLFFWFCMCSERFWHVPMMEDDENLASPLHTVLGDTISLLYMLTSATRIAVYSKFNPTFRQHLYNLVSDYCPAGQTSARLRDSYSQRIVPSKSPTL
ncbi:unnamed protein product [Gongylonema pulchrum]|uniref:Secreted protein n=1 Tax=Gongylonema pulchrum TaxID=637853 RepID=A0A183EMU7_9BILA|nr:unnamed protein product [Gongylonema pulchrum]